MYPEELYSYNYGKENVLSNVNSDIFRHFIINSEITGDKLDLQQIKQAVRPDFEFDDNNDQLLFTLSHSISLLTKPEYLRIRITNKKLIDTPLDYNSKIKLDDTDFKIDNRRGVYSVNAKNIKKGTSNLDKSFLQFQNKKEGVEYTFQIDIKHKPEQFNFAHCNLIIHILKNGRHITEKPIKSAIKAAKKFIRKLILENHKVVLHPGSE